MSDAAERPRGESGLPILKGTGEATLRRRFSEWQYGDQWTAALDEALAAERRATVERIRTATKDINVWPVTLDRILDAEAER